MIKAKPAPWLMEKIHDLKNHEQTRNTVKLEAKKSGFRLDWAVSQKLRNFVVKINRESKTEFYSDTINKNEKNPKPSGTLLTAY